jgi:tRNA threonylcarbamoyl adenosine modification protein (Sua5/YciO/YrdC/YwlC family)
MIHYSVHPVNPQRHILEKVAAMLRREDAICVYPTDTVYGMGSPVNNAKAIDRVSRLMEKDKSRLFSFVCSDFPQISTYARLSNNQFKIMKHYLPGPFTFILPATPLVPKKVCPKRKTVGIRLPDCIVCLELVRLLGEPLANTSIRLEGGLRGDPDEVRPAVLNEVDVMLDIGMLENPVNSTIVDLTEENPVVVRQGKGEFNG